MHYLSYSLGLGFVSVLPVVVADDVETTTEVEVLPEMRVVSSRVSNQEPVGTFAMPVSALTFEPLVDVQARNFSEGQADISIRGGTFENTGFSIGALPIYDPQTGHYFAELPVAPAMLGAPEVRTGSENSIGGWNATAGSVGYGWAPVRSGGYLSAGAGDNSLIRGDAYLGAVADQQIFGRTLAADVNIAASQGEGTRSFGDHDFARYNARLQLRDETSQTDVFAGYQTKFFGWRGLYAQPFTSNESEDLQTQLYLINHRLEFGADDDYLEFGAYHRINNDEYRFNRATPPAPAPAPAFVHETRVTGLSAQGRSSVGECTALRYRAGLIADEIDSRSLTFGPFESRTQLYAGLYLDHTIELAEGANLVLTGGANYDDSNRDGSAVSPVLQAAWERADSMVRRVYLSYAEATQVPTYTALSSNPVGGLFGGNPNLGRSESRNFELGSELALAEWQLSTAVFYRQDRDQLDWVFGGATPPPPIRRAVAGDVDTFGFEAVVRRQWQRIDLVLGYTLMDKNEDYLAAGESSFYVYDFARHRVTAAITARLGAGFELRMDNEYRIQEENTLRRRNDEPILSALGLVYRVPGVAGLTLNAQVDNLWNTYYEEVAAVPGARRTWSAGATYAW